MYSKNNEECLKNIYPRHKQPLAIVRSFLYICICTLAVTVRDEFIVGLMVRQVDVYVAVNWWAHAMLAIDVDTAADDRELNKLNSQ